MVKLSQMKCMTNKRIFETKTGYKLLGTSENNVYSDRPMLKYTEDSDYDIL